MNSDEEILDSPEQLTSVQQKFKSRVPSDLMIVLGIAHTLLAAYSLYLFLSTLSYAMNSAVLIEPNTGFLTFIRIFAMQSFPLLFGIITAIGGVGLLRHKKMGWIFALAIAIFSILLPLLKLAMYFYLPGIEWSVSNFFGFLFLLFFGLSFIFLISKTIRTFYAPRDRDYYKVVVIALVLALNFLLTPLLFLSHQLN